MRDRYDHSKAETVNKQIIRSRATAEAGTEGQVRSYAPQCVISDGSRNLGTGISLNSSFIPCHNSKILHTHSFTTNAVQSLLYCSNSCNLLDFKILKPHTKTDTLYNKCKSIFQFSNLAKYGHGPPEDGLKGDRNM